ncbi:hypothetical protein ACJZ2D_005761 [Fusarium nematophilum]
MIDPGACRIAYLGSMNDSSPLAETRKTLRDANAMTTRSMRSLKGIGGESIDLEHLDLISADVNAAPVIWERSAANKKA